MVRGVGLFYFLSLLMILLRSGKMLVRVALQVGDCFFFICVVLIPTIVSSVGGIRVHVNVCFDLRLILLLCLIHAVYFGKRLCSLIPCSVGFGLFGWVSCCRSYYC